MSLPRKRSSFAVLLIAAMLLHMAGVLYVAPEPAHAAGTTYYVDSAGGNDTNPGTSASAPWATLAKVNGTTFQPGDKILFKSGGVWTGQLWPKGSGTNGNPIVIDSYGSGAKPIINGAGTSYPANTSGAVMLYNQEYWEINNLEVTNFSSSIVSSRAGILVYNNQPGLKNHIYVRNCYVHDVNSDVNGNKNSGGIIFFGTHIDKDGKATVGLQAGFNDVLVENNHVANVTKEGIRTKSDAGNGYPKISTNVVFRGNFVEEVWGDGMVLAEVLSGALAEYNTVKNHSKTSSGNYAGLWTHYTTGAVVQFNEVYGGSGGNNDGEAFDSDNNCVGDVFQYNYSHNNSGGLLLVMPSASNLKFRYNISENDGYRSGQEIFFYHSTNAGNEIYNNTVYVGPNVTTQIFDNDSNMVKFYNNIIKADGTITKFAEKAWSTSAVFKNNSFYPATIDDINGPASHPGLVTADPQLVNPGAGETNINMNDPNRLNGYKLQPTSPLINSGVSVANNGGRDFWGTALYNGNPDIGAFEYASGGPIPPSVSYEPIADSYVRDGAYAGTNYGTEATMMVKADASGYARKSYVKFNYGTFGGSSAASAKVKVYVPAVNTDASRTVKLYGTADESWSETGITWNNAPAGTTLIGSVVIGNTVGTWYEFDVTSYINSQMSDKLVSFLLVKEGAASSKGDVSFNTKEAASNKPQLVLTQ